MHPIFEIIYVVIDLYIWALIISAILSWLVTFNVLNTRNRLVYVVGDFLYRLTEPVLRPIRRMVPLLGGIDVSPIVAILALFFVQRMIVYYATSL